MVVQIAIPLITKILIGFLYFRGKWHLTNQQIYNCLTLAKTEAGSDGIDEHVAISNKNDAHINEEDCENERPDLVDATQRKNGPR